MTNEQAQTTFDRFHANAEGMPDVKHTKPTSIKSAMPLVGNVQDVMVQTYKSEEFGFAIAVTVVNAEGTVRLVLQNKVALAIYRQRQSLTDRSTPESRARRTKSREAQRKRTAKLERQQRYREKDR